MRACVYENSSDALCVCVFVCNSLHPVPYLPQKVQANIAVCVDVFMPRGGLEEVDAGGLGRVVHREGEL
jgi:hypothetical protein